MTVLTLSRIPLGEWFDEVNRLQNRVQKLFAAESETEASLNIWADETAFYVDVDLPGIDPKKLDVTVVEGTKLTITGERSFPKNDVAWVRQERPVGQFTRTVGLPALVEIDSISANYEHGVLKLTLPKSEAAKPRKIAITAK